MMKKWLLLISPLFLLHTSVEAWGGRYNHPPVTTDSASLDTHFPLNEEQGWFTEESYLLLKPTLGDLEYGDMISFGEGDHSTKIKVKSPSFEWNSGVRLGIGRYLPNHDKWDVSLYSTYFYGQAEDTVHGNLDHLKGLATSYNPFVVILSEKTEATWRLNYFVWDLMLGRQFAMTPQIVFHPYIGLRGALMYTTFTSKNFGDMFIASHLVAGNSKVKMHENFWGIGARIGSNLDYKFTGNWSFLGNLAGSLLYGRYHVREKSVTHITPPTPTLTSKTRDHDNAIRVNLEGAVGLGWETWFQNNTIRVAPNLQFEGSLWFDMNDFIMPSNIFSQDHGNLGLMGLTFNLQVDF